MTIKYPKGLVQLVVTKFVGIWLLLCQQVLILNPRA
jgi:hypothetical protein